MAPRLVNCCHMYRRMLHSPHADNMLPRVVSSFNPTEFLIFPLLSSLAPVSTSMSSLPSSVSSQTSPFVTFYEDMNQHTPSPGMRSGHHPSSPFASFSTPQHSTPLHLPTSSPLSDRLRRLAPPPIDTTPPKDDLASYLLYQREPGFPSKKIQHIKTGLQIEFDLASSPASPYDASPPERVKVFTSQALQDLLSGSPSAVRQVHIEDDLPALDHLNIIVERQNASSFLAPHCPNLTVRQRRSLDSVIDEPRDVLINFRNDIFAELAPPDESFISDTPDLTNTSTISISDSPLSRHGPCNAIGRDDSSPSVHTFGPVRQGSEKSQQSVGSEWSALLGAYDRASLNRRESDHSAFFANLVVLPRPKALDDFAISDTRDSNNAPIGFTNAREAPEASHELQLSPLQNWRSRGLGQAQGDRSLPDTGNIVNVVPVFHIEVSGPSPDRCLDKVLKVHRSASKRNRHVLSLQVHVDQVSEMCGGGFHTANDSGRRESSSHNSAIHQDDQEVVV